MPELLGSTTAGLQVPVIPFVDVFVKMGTVPFPQIVSAVPKGKTGTVLCITVTVMVTGIAQLPDAGVNI